MKSALFSLFILLLLLDCTIIHAQETDSSVHIKVEQRDVVDYSRIWFGLKPSSKSDMKPGDKPVLSVLPAVGYTLQTRLAGIISGNLAFYTRKQKDAKLSVINSSMTYSQNKQFFIPIQTNLWILHDQVNLLGDWRYMKYPQSTFGLGSDAPVQNENPMDFRYVRFYQYLLIRVTDHLSAGPGFQFDKRWDISEKGLPGNQASDYALYGASSQTTSAGISANLLFDKRDNPINAQKGIYANMVARTNPSNWNASPWSSLILDVRKYIPISSNGKNVLALWSYNWLILSGKPPYLDLPSTGWDNFNNTGRGYIQGRFRGKQFVYAEAEYRFRITANGLVGAVVFTNIQTASGWPDRHLQQWQPAAGGGIRIKLNKKSNTNVAIDYGVGVKGSGGLSVNVGEVF